MVSVVLPALLTPLLLSAGQWMQQRRESQAMNGTYWVGVAGENPALAESLLLEALSIPFSGDSMNIGIGASYPADSEEGVLRPEEATVEVLASPSGGQPTIRILYRADDEGSGLVASNIQDRFLVLRDTLRTRMLSEDGCRFSPDQAYVTTMDTSPPWRRAGARVGSFAVLFLMLFLLSGGAVVAIDMVAGERERGTLETLLASSASRAEIVQAKFLAILTVSAAISLTQLLSLVICISVRFLPSADLQALRFGPWALAQAVLLISSLAALVSATLLLISGRAASVKEAQLHYFPVFLLAILPALAPVFPELTSEFPFVFIPVSGVALCMRDVLAGRAEFLNVLMASVSTFALAGAALWAAHRALVAEKMVAGSESRTSRPSPASFPSKVLKFMAVMWALTTIFSLQAANADIRVQLAVNTLVILLGGTLFVWKRYGLSGRIHLSLVLPRPVAAALAVPGALSGAVAGIGLFKLVDGILPVSQSQLQAFGQALLPAGMPRWQLLLFLAILPGMCEELAFRGMLLGGLARRMPRTLAVLASALVFGFFHFSWFRIVPTAFLGVLLASSVLLSGSILPAMIWHILNNALVILLPAGVDLSDQPLWLYMLSAGVCAGCLYGMRAGGRRAGTAYPR